MSVSRTSLTSISSCAGISGRLDGSSASACLCAGAFWGYAWYPCGCATQLQLGSMQIQSRPFSYWFGDGETSYYLIRAALSAPSTYSLVPPGIIAGVMHAQRAAPCLSVLPVPPAQPLHEVLADVPAALIARTHARSAHGIAQPDCMPSTPADEPATASSPIARQPMRRRHASSPSSS